MRHREELEGKLEESVESKMSDENYTKVQLTTCHSLAVVQLLDVLGLRGFPVARLVISAEPEKLVEVTATLHVPETQTQALVEAFKQDPNPTVKSIGVMK